MVLKNANCQVLKGLRVQRKLFFLPPLLCGEGSGFRVCHDVFHNAFKTLNPTSQKQAGELEFRKPEILDPQNQLNSKRESQSPDGDVRTDV